MPVILIEINFSEEDKPEKLEKTALKLEEKLREFSSVESITSVISSRSVKVSVEVLDEPEEKLREFSSVESITSVISSHLVSGHSVKTSIEVVE